MQYALAEDHPRLPGISAPSEPTHHCINLILVVQTPNVTAYIRLASAMSAQHADDKLEGIRADVIDAAITNMRWWCLFDLIYILLLMEIGT